MNLDEYPTLTEARKVIAKSLGVEPEALAKALEPIEAMYAVADHARTLLFAITDGLPPSNVGGGYNLRVLFRRAQSFIDYHGFKFLFSDVVNWHIDQLGKMYPELEEHRDDVAKVLAVESSRYTATVQRVSRTVASLAASKKNIGVDDLVKLYDSDGITPEQLVEGGAKVAVPEDFYQRVVAKHVSQKLEQKRPEFDTSGLPETRALYYEDGEKFEFEAKVLKAFQGGYVVLDQTAFYPRGGGQEPDHGTIEGRPVTDIEKYAGVIVHKVEGLTPRGGPEGRREGGRQEAAEDTPHPHSHAHPQRGFEAGPRPLDLAALGVQGGGLWPARHHPLRQAHGRGGQEDRGRRERRRHEELPDQDHLAPQEGGRGQVRVQALPGRGGPVQDPSG